MHQAETASRNGAWVAGFIAYEAAGAFGLPVLPTPTGHPLVWMASFSRVQQVLLPHLPKQPTRETTIAHLSLDAAQYRQDLEAILDAIGRGETYQVNHTLTATITPCDPAKLFLHLQGLHRFPYGAWLNFGVGRIASFSPELLIENNHGHIITAPIKGTRPRLETVVADQQLARELEDSVKDRAEHVMIVDMARNDLGRICTTGSVQVEHLCARRSFSTIHHLETRVKGRLREHVGFAEVMAAIFPAASITGAPKKRTMELIRQRERHPREIYTGSIGWLAPGSQRWRFNVAIRTVTWWGNAMGTLGLGGGIVADSKVEEEWRELADKGRFLDHPPKPFGLIETCLVNREGVIPRLNAHLQRLSRSADTLGFSCPIIEIERQLRHRASLCHPRPRVLRLVLNMGGEITLSEREWRPSPPLLQAYLAPASSDRWDGLLRHKTTRRAMFDHFLAEARNKGLDECLFVNTMGHLTEGAIRAVAVRLRAGWVVPPLEDGLLPSLWREAFICEHPGVQTRSLTLEDLSRAEEIRVGNAVSGESTVTRIVDDAGKVIWEKEII
ncbi:MAG: chorismate-binding protein [Nitrospirae bacterium]|nr:chorismate-binding protein [Magnetococcales bacterium]